MASKKARRSEWTRNKAGGWRRSLGSRGNRVRLFQKRRDGTFYRVVWIPGIGANTKTLKTCDRTEAERLGRALLAELVCGNTQQNDGRITLGELWKRFRIESPSFLDVARTTRKDYRARTTTLLGYFGADCDVTTITPSDAAAYTRKRLAGGIKITEDRITVPVRPRTVEADLVLLKCMLKWATTVRDHTGQRWLKDNPLHGIKRIHEKNPKRPVANWDRFVKTRKAMRELEASSRSERAKDRWIKLELALVIAEATGRRLNSIRQLRWEDIDFDRSRINWRADADKKGKQWTVPLHEELANELEAFRKCLGAIGGWIFARWSDGKQPMDRHLFDHWLTVAEKHAGLPKLEGGLWHPYRRKWATERKDLPISDVAWCGGWSDIETLLRCYQQPDEESLLQVMNHKKKLSNRTASR